MALKKICIAVALACASQAYAAPTTGPSTTTTPYLTAVATGLDYTSILTTGDSVGGYLMGGIPDGLGAYDNNDGTFTLLMNHEIGTATVAGVPNTPLGTVRAHGAAGAYVSKWVINKTTLAVTSGQDLMTSVKNANGSAYTGSLAFSRFCSADLPAATAFYNPVSGLGTQTRLFMNGEESSAGSPVPFGSIGSRALAHTADGSNAGTSYVLSAFGAASWENLAANAKVQDKTVVVGQSDGNANVGGTNVNGAVAVYVGTKQATGTDAEKAGLNNGTTYYVNVAGVTAERTNTAAGASPSTIANGTAFSLTTNAATAFSRPEDGAWISDNEYVFVTTDRIDTTELTGGTQVGRSRLYKMTFADISDPTLGGTIDTLLDGTEGQIMLDNLSFNSDGTLSLLEDTGNAAHNGKVWKYNLATDTLTLDAKSDVTRFGDVVGGVFQNPGTTFLTQDEETSGIIDVSSMYNDGKLHQLIVMQNHAAATGVNATTLVEGGQLLMQTSVAAVPEADTYSMMLTGLGLMGFVARRRNSKK
ncbi:MAG: PEP-CTERM sorting domain-containing protein [Methylophilaceae bacterium]